MPADLGAAALDVDADRFGRTVALLMTVFAALPALPVEHLDQDATPRLRARVRGRAAVARFALDRLAATAGG